MIPVPRRREKVTIRRSRARDVFSMAWIDKRGYRKPWCIHIFDRFKKKPENEIFVAEDTRGEITGYICFRMTDTDIGIYRLGVHPGVRRMGVGSILLGEAIRRLGRRKTVKAASSEDNGIAHLFLRANGFKCMKTLSSAKGNEYYLFELKR